MKRNIGLVCTTLPLALHSVLTSASCVQATDSSWSINASEATDPGKRLVWKRCAVGMEWDQRSGRCTGNPLGLSHDEAKKAAKRTGPGWRLPTAEELGSLRRRTCSGPKIDAKVFPAVAASDFGEGANFWSATAAEIPGTLYYVNFTDGAYDFHSAGFSLSVFLVKNL
ncbi:DUF1566 domain-containing protein [Caballeronia sp. LZ033]|uniref:Lcl C-terminal domain-containing protein n=1 Tax=Caballeronia sp. LZ033 TaxID=3038566 RepID=UPI00285D7628|nr:DUF1566 domain-containing protein [Caballeronia sp. LZ033]MDR5812533.1 DUF1566 domain-containing protein [Caballeronia sp. LZ033]